MSIKTQMASLRREMKVGGHELVTTADIRGALRFVRLTGFLPDPIGFPKMNENMRRALAFLDYARGQAEGYVRPPALAAYEQMTALGHPARLDFDRQVLFVMLWASAYGDIGTEDDWRWAKLQRNAHGHTPWAVAVDVLDDDQFLSRLDLRRKSATTFTRRRANHG